LTLSKRLKQKIKEISGLLNLSKEERSLKAHEILDSNEAKQAICRQILGCTFKEVERVMLSVIQERQLTESQKEQIELQKVAPHKFNPEIEFEMEFELNSKLYNRREIVFSFYSIEESRRLVEESKISKAQERVVVPNTNYPSYSLEEVKKLLREGGELWDSTKTTESEQKTKSSTKRMKPIKPSKK
jgi:predicted RNA methylase